MLGKRFRLSHHLQTLRDLTISALVWYKQVMSPTGEVVQVLLFLPRLVRAEGGFSSKSGLGAKN